MSEKPFLAEKPIPAEKPILAERANYGWKAISGKKIWIKNHSDQNVTDWLVQFWLIAISGLKAISCQIAISDRKDISGQKAISGRKAISALKIWLVLMQPLMSHNSSLD